MKSTELRRQSPGGAGIVCAMVAVLGAAARRAGLLAFETVPVGLAVAAQHWIPS